MTKRTLLASVVLFRELYESDKDVYDVIAEFVKAALLFSQKWSFNTTEAAELLRREFEFDIPDAVVSTTLRNRLRTRDDILSYDNGIYCVSRDRLLGSQSLVDDLRRLQEQQKDVLARLTSHVESTVGTLAFEQRELLARCFCDYLFDNNANTRFSKEISAFVLRVQGDPNVTTQLNAIREGFILYDGVRHAPDLNHINSWKSKLTIFLDTEHLFNAAGMNGVLYKQLVRDLISLASDVREKGSRLIHFRYFSESIDEVDRFFRVAEDIVEGKATLDPSKPAMAAIVNGCASKGDVITKKAKFLAYLNTLGIRRAEASEEVVVEEFNIESSSLVDKIEKEFKEKQRDFQKEKCISTLRMFTKVNSLRSGESSKPLEDIGFILVSGSYISNYLSFHSDVRSSSTSVPYATDLEFITNRLWFRVHKNLAKERTRPQSLSVLAKAQVVLSSQIQGSVSEKYDKIKEDFGAGKITEEETKILFNELRAHVAAPEAITDENIEYALAFLDHRDYEHHLRERSHLEKQAAEGSAAIEQLNAIRASERSRRVKWATAASLAVHLIAGLTLLAFIIGCGYAAYSLLMQLGSGGNDQLSVLGLIVTVVSGLMPLVKYRSIWALANASHIRLATRLVGTRA